MQMKLSALLLILMLLAGCASADLIPLEKQSKTNADALVKAQTTIAQQQAAITALQGQVAALQKQLTASDNRSGQYATKAELNTAIQALNPTAPTTQVMQRLAVVEGSDLVLKSRIDTLQADVTRSLTMNQVRIDAAVNQLGSTSPAMTAIASLQSTITQQQAQITDLQNRLAAHGW